MICNLGDPRSLRHPVCLPTLSTNCYTSLCIGLHVSFRRTFKSLFIYLTNLCPCNVKHASRHACKHFQPRAVDAFASNYTSLLIRLHVFFFTLAHRISCLFPSDYSFLFIYSTNLCPCNMHRSSRHACRHFQARAVHAFASEFTSRLSGYITWNVSSDWTSLFNTS